MRAETPADAPRVAALVTPEEHHPPLERESDRPLPWVRTQAELSDALAVLAAEPVVGLDVETTLATRALCLVQIASRRATYLIDALEVPDMSPLSALLGSRSTLKVIHNASFERAVLGRHGLSIEAVVDTREVSRRLRVGVRGHGLRDVCARELCVVLDKREQTGDWTRRPLTESQVAYAALDAEVLLRLYDRFQQEGAAGG